MADIHAMGLPRSGFSAYAMSKAALVELIRSLARELAPRVRVNGVAPGVVAWPEEGYEADEEAQRAYLKRVALERAGTPEDAAAAVAWLALDATYVTGQVIRLDGGRSLL
jgi:pteridine reductase